MLEYLPESILVELVLLGPPKGLGFSRSKLVSAKEFIKVGFLLSLAIILIYNDTTLPLISVLGNLTSKIEGSWEGYITPFWVAPSIA
tara:strand:+ start:317 stop:577 length:261 start_codon:yes stop_codon:yes gene_type:complete